MASYNKAILMGRITSAPEVKQTANGTSVVNVSLAVDRGFGEDKKTDFIPVVFFGKIADAIGKYTNKGSSILVSGQLQTNSYEDKAGNKRTTFEVFATEFAFCEAKASGSANPSAESQSGSTAKLEPVGDDLPF